MFSSYVDVQMPPASHLQPCVLAYCRFQLLQSILTMQGIHLTTGTRTSILVKQTDFSWVEITVPKFRLNSQDKSLSNTPENTD